VPPALLAAAIFVGMGWLGRTVVSGDIQLTGGPATAFSLRPSECSVLTTQMSMPDHQPSIELRSRDARAPVVVAWGTGVSGRHLELRGGDGAAPRVITSTNCPGLDVEVEWTGPNESTNGSMRGFARADCPFDGGRLRANIEFERCR
jgi:hypothetical protein